MENNINEEVIEEKKGTKSKGKIVITIVVIGLLSVAINVGILFGTGVLGSDNTSSDDATVEEEKNDKKNTNEEDSDEEDTKIEDDEKEVEEFPNERKILIEFGFAQEGTYSRDLAKEDVYTKGYTTEKKITNVVLKLYDDTKKDVTCANLLGHKFAGQKSYEIKDIGFCWDVEGDKPSYNLVKYEKANALYKEMYGEDMPKMSARFGALDRVYYSEKYDSFTKVDCNCGGTNGPNLHIDKIKEVKKDNNKLTVYYYHQDFLPIMEEEGIYYDITDKNGNRYQESKNLEKKVKEEALDKINLYEIVFDINSNGTYKLNSFKKI